ncbi:MAG: hypothetical protein U5N21_00945 [Rhodococcus sp. (in: high G+C Gram-positive bacteria)]|nr:hypothetical protein [Rhodococcus sp. (in: high G+C Gram-positive bacteria)]
MNARDPNILSRYQQSRTQMFLDSDKHYANFLPGLRAQKRRRTFVIALIVVLALQAGFALATLGLRGALGGWALSYIAFSFASIVLGIVSHSRAEAPEEALDEYEVARRNHARSIGLTVTQVLGTAAAAYLFLGAMFLDNPDLALSGGALVLTALSAGKCTPAMILAWTTPDPEPEDG